MLARCDSIFSIILIFILLYIVAVTAGRCRDYRTELTVMMTATVICSLDHGLMSLTAGLGQLSLLSSMARQNECELYDCLVITNGSGMFDGSQRLADS